MAEIYNFKGKNEPEEDHCDCEYCQLTYEYMDYIKICDNDEKLFNVLRNLVSESSNLTIIDFLERENENNVELIDKLRFGLDKE